MSENEKLIKAKKSIKILFYLSVFYFVLLLSVFIDSFFISKDQDLSLTGSVAIFFYVLILATSIFAAVNLYKLKSPKLIRKKAINDADERLLSIHRMTGAFSFYFMLLLLFVALVISVSLNSIELFGFSLISIIVMVIVHIFVKLILKKFY